METKRDAYRTTYHRDGAVTVWDVHQQEWVRTDRPEDRILASLPMRERERIIQHCRIA
jgi:hypothetical protein